MSNKVTLNILTILIQKVFGRNYIRADIGRDALVIVIFTILDLW